MIWLLDFYIGKAYNSDKEENFRYEAKSLWVSNCKINRSYLDFPLMDLTSIDLMEVRFQKNQHKE